MAAARKRLPGLRSLHSLRDRPQNGGQNKAVLGIRFRRALFGCARASGMLIIVGKGFRAFDPRMPRPSTLCLRIDFANEPREYSRAKPVTKNTTMRIIYGSVKTNAAGTEYEKANPGDGGWSVEPTPQGTTQSCKIDFSHAFEAAPVVVATGNSDGSSTGTDHNVSIASVTPNGCVVTTEDVARAQGEEAHKVAAFSFVAISQS